MTDEPLNRDSVSSVLGYEGSHQGWSRRTSLSLAGDSDTGAEPCPPGELFIRVEGGISNFICQIPVSASKPFQNSGGEQEHYL